jgi:hypothetical protein
LVPGDDSTRTYFDWTADLSLIEIGGEIVVSSSYTLTDGQLGDQIGVDGVI